MLGRQPASIYCPKSDLNNFEFASRQPCWDTVSITSAAYAMSTHDVIRLTIKICLIHSLIVSHRVAHSYQTQHLTSIHHQSKIPIVNGQRSRITYAFVRISDERAVESFDTTFKMLKQRTGERERLLSIRSAR